MDQLDPFPMHHFQVFRAEIRQTFDEVRHFIYVETRLCGGSAAEGHSFHLSRLPSGLAVFSAQPSERPFTSDRNARMWLVGWVRRSDFQLGKIEKLCETVPLSYPGQPSPCCHEWTEGAIATLRGAKVLQPLRSSDDGERVYVANYDTTDGQGDGDL